MANELMNTDPFADDPFENIFKGFFSFNLGQDIDASQAQARCENGVLELTLPKKTDASSRRLPVA